MKTRIGNLITAGSLLILTLPLLLLGEFYWEYRADVIMFPWMAGAVVIISSIWLMARSSIVSIGKLSEEGESLGDSSNSRSSLFKRIAWLASVFPICYLLGLVLGLVSYTFLYTSYHLLPWWQRIFATSAVFIVVYVGFYVLLGVPLPTGPLWIR